MVKLFTLRFLLLVLIFGSTLSQAKAQVTHLVISQVYGGGGNSGATYKNDFIEIFNPTAASVNVTGWSVQYASSSGTTWQVTALSGAIPAGGYYLVQEAQGSGGTVNLPAPDATGTIAMSGSAGKVALVSNNTALSGSCPAGGALVDFIGYGTANCFEGTAASPALSNTTAALRGSNGCTDTDVNGSDFTTGAPNPRNVSSPVNICGGVVKTVSVAAGTDAAEPAANGSFTINLSTATTASTDINFAFGGTAIFGTDYTVAYSAGSTISTTAAGTLTLPSGTTSITVTITPIDDALVEGAELISLTLSSPTEGYTIGTASQNINLADDDVPTVSVIAGLNAGEPATQGSFNITLSDPAPVGGVTISYTLAGSATLNTDYSDPQSGSITIAAGSTTGAILINTIDDMVYEGTETIAVTLATASNGYSIATSAATINLMDDEPLPAIVINEVYGGGGNSGAEFKNDFIELYNPTNIAVNLAGWSVQYGSATSTTWSGKTILTGTIAAKGYYLIQQSAGSGGTTALPTPDDIGTISMSGTAGKVALVANSVTLSGACPAAASYVDLVGFGSTANCFEGAGTAPAPSNTTSIQRNPKGFDTNNNNTDFVVITPATPKNSVVDIIPPVISSLFPADDNTGVMTSFIANIVFNENVQKGTGTILLKKLSDGSIFKTIDVASSEVSVAGTSVSFNINSLAFNTAYYFEISAGAFIDGNDNNFAGLSGTTAWNFTTIATPPIGLLGTTYDFNTCSGNLPGGFSQFNIVGSQVWSCTAFGRDAANPPSGSAPNGLQMNGFANGIDNSNTDWLISPSFDLTATSFPLLSFWSRTAFAGATLQLKVSTDYSGTGDPNLATWTDLNGKFPSPVSDVWTLSENINLSNYKTANTYFAFVYSSTTEDGARWTLDDITVTNSPTAPPASITISTTDIQYTFVANGSTLDKTFTFTGNDLTGDVTLGSTGAFLLSKDGISFSAALTYTLAEANNILKTVYVRFAPTAANQNFSGSITISTPGVTTYTINLNGSSIDPITTLEIVNWNMEWFGAPNFGPADNNLQEQNATTVLKTIAADIYGVVEIVDEARLQNVVNSLNATFGAGTYSYQICDYGSRVNPPDPNGGPLADAQKEAFIYKTALFSNVTTRALINNQNISSTSYNSWASGRYPFLMTADVTLNCVTKKMNFVLLHAKANTAPIATSYARRQAAANELHDTLTTYFANDNVVVLGDLNDDLDQSITAGFTTTSYSSFTTDAANFFAPTLALSLAGKKSTVSYNDVIDHVIVSNELVPNYLPASATILTDVASLINKYGSTTSDHYPVFTRYIFPNAVAPVVSGCTANVMACSNATGIYTIPAFTATDDCNDPISYTYTISGATQRSGTTNNASGMFSPGTSTIVWTATDGWNNSATCSTTVTINESPMAVIPNVSVLPLGVAVNTVYIGYAPASVLTVTAIPSLGTPSYTFSWSAGSGLAIMGGTANQASVKIYATGSGIYTSTLTVTITDSKGCSVSKSITIRVMDVRGGNKNDKVLVCHNGNTLTVSDNAVQSHLNHGDRLGACDKKPTNKLYVLLKCILSNFPNPFHGFTTIKYSLSLDSKVSVEISDVFGRKITTLFNGDKKAGSYTVDYNTLNLRRGIYFCKVTAISDDQASVQTIILLAQ